MTIEPDKDAYDYVDGFAASGFEGPLEDYVAFHDILTQIERNGKERWVQSIKDVRTLYQCSLKDGRSFVDEILAGHIPNVPPKAFVDEVLAGYIPARPMLDADNTLGYLEPVKESMFDHASETVKALQKSYFRTVLHTITDPMLSTAEQGMIACLVRNSIEEFERALKLLGHP